MCLLEKIKRDRDTNQQKLYSCDNKILLRATEIFVFKNATEKTSHCYEHFRRVYGRKLRGGHSYKKKQFMLSNVKTDGHNDKKCSKGQPNTCSSKSSEEEKA